MQSAAADNRWLEIYNEAVVFYRTHKRFPTGKDNARLYKWATQWWRNSYLNNPSMLKNKAEMLTNIGFVYRTVENRYDHLWMKNYEECKEFFEKHEHFPTMKECPKLHAWARSWWGLYGDKQPEKAGMLQLVGYTYKTVEQRGDEQWLKNYEECKAFFDQHGRFPEKADNIRLRNWVNRWWKKTAEGQPEKAKMLAAIGFSYRSAEDFSSERWMKNYLQCKEFFEKNGRFPTYKDVPRLNGWVRMWWKNTYLKNPVANKEKAEMLMAIGFNPNKSEDDE